MTSFALALLLVGCHSCWTLGAGSAAHAEAVGFAGSHLPSHGLTPVRCDWHAGLPHQRELCSVGRGA